MDLSFFLPTRKPPFWWLFHWESLALALSIRNGADTLSGANIMKEGDEGWLDFKAIKEKMDVRLVLSRLGLLEHLEERSAELVGWCPFGDEHGKQDSFSINVEKKTFQCFACKARGSALDFIAKMKNGNLREAARWVVSVMNGEEPREKTKAGRPYGKGEVAPPTPGGGETPAVMSFSIASRLIIGKKINPETLLVIDLSRVEK